MSEEIDSVDLKLMRTLARNAKTSLHELGREVGLSVSGVKRRLDKLQRKGIIKGYTVVLNPKKYGWAVAAFVLVEADSKSMRELVDKLERKREVCEIHKVAGGDSIFLKIRARSVDDLNRFIETNVSSQDGVKNVTTFISMESFKEVQATL